MAIGQLIDYGRFEDAAVAKGVLLPTRPRPDLENLLKVSGVAMVWRDDAGGFKDNASGRFI